MLALSSSLPLQQQQQPELQQLMLAGISAAPSGLPSVISEGLQVQTADSLSTALLLSQIQLQQQTSASIALAGCSGSSMGLGLTAEAAVLDQGPLLVESEVLQLQLQLAQVSLGGTSPSATAASMAPTAGIYSCTGIAASQDGYYIEDQLTAMGAALDAQLQALLAVRSEINRRRSMSAEVSPRGPSQAVMAVWGDAGNGLF
jgi:hypothetical protein